MIAPTTRASGKEPHPGDRRVCYRIPLLASGAMSIVQVTDDPVSAFAGRLINISGGGCGVLAPKAQAIDLATGARCLIILPFGKDGLRQPATLTAVNMVRDSGLEVHLRFRFRKADAVTRQQLIRWLGDLAVKRLQA